MPAPVIYRSQFVDLYSSSALPALEELFRLEFDRHPSRRELIFKMVSTDKDIYQSSEIHDLPLMDEVPEGQAFTFARPKAGASKTLTISKWGLGFSISEEAVADGRFDWISELVRKLARSARESQEFLAMDIINNGFTATTGTLTSDGLPLFYSVHTLPSGVTWRNVLATAADLSATSLETALADFESQMVGDSGIIYSIRPKVLLTGPAFKRTAKELIGSELKVNNVASENGPTNAYNSFAEDGLMAVSSPHLTDTQGDSWFLFSDPMDHGLRIVVREPLQTKAGGPDVGFANDSILYKARFREKQGALHPYGAFGSPGA